MNSATEENARVAQPDWMQITPPQEVESGWPIASLMLFCGNDCLSVQEVELTRTEYIELKRHLAIVRGLGTAPEVRIHVEGGIAFVDEVPPGVTVAVVDFDVDAQSPSATDAGRPCSRYTVTAEALEGGSWTDRERRELGPACVQLTEPEAALAHLARSAEAA